MAEFNLFKHYFPHSFPLLIRIKGLGGWHMPRALQQRLVCCLSPAAGTNPQQFRRQEHPCLGYV